MSLALSPERARFRCDAGTATPLLVEVLDQADRSPTDAGIARIADLAVRCDPRGRGLFAYALARAALLGHLDTGADPAGPVTALGLLSAASGRRWWTGGGTGTASDDD